MVRWLWALCVLVCLGCASTGVDRQSDREIGKARQALPFGPAQKLVPAEASANNYLGGAVAVDGNTAFVAPDLESVAAGTEGWVYTFVRSGGSWNEQQRITPSGNLPDDLFGLSLDVAGDTAAIGAPGVSLIAQPEPSNGNEGAVYIFNRSGSTWTEATRIVAPELVDSLRFGEAVALDGDTLLVGCGHFDTLPYAERGAYVFVRSGGNWLFQQKLLDPDGAAVLHPVALHGDTALVKVSGGYGHVDVFVRSGATWSFQQQLLTHDVEVRTLGDSVALYGDTALLGNPMREVGIDAFIGAAWVFTRTAETWTERAKLVLSGPTVITSFGASVALHDGVALVGAPADDVDTNDDQGSVTVFTGSDANWTQENVFTLFNGDAESEAFGTTLAFDGAGAIVGFPSDNDPVNNAGSAVVYSLDSVGPGGSGQVGSGGTAQAGSAGNNGSGGTGTSGSGGSSDGGTTGSAEAGAGPGNEGGANGGASTVLYVTSDEGGCGCRLSVRSPKEHFAIALLAALAILRRRRN